MLVVPAAVGLVVDLVLLASESPGALAALLVAAAVYAFFSARALSLGVEVPAVEAEPGRPPGRCHRAHRRSAACVTVPAGLIVNEWSGGGKAEQVGLVDHARQLGIDVVVLREGDDLIELAEGLVAGGVQVLGMAGGDGSLGLVAEVCRQHDRRSSASRSVPATTSPATSVSTGRTRRRARGLPGPRAHHRRGGGVVGRRRRTNVLNNATFGAYADMVADPGLSRRQARDGAEAGERRPQRRPRSIAAALRGPDGQVFDSAFLIMVAVGDYQLDTIAEIGVRSALDAANCRCRCSSRATNRSCGG